MSRMVKTRKFQKAGKFNFFKRRQPESKLVSRAPSKSIHGEPENGIPITTAQSQSEVRRLESGAELNRLASIFANTKSDAQKFLNEREKKQKKKEILESGLVYTNPSYNPQKKKGGRRTRKQRRRRMTRKRR